MKINTGYVDWLNKEENCNGKETLLFDILALQLKFQPRIRRFNSMHISVKYYITLFVFYKIAHLLVNNTQRKYFHWVYKGAEMNISLWAAAWSSLEPHHQSAPGISDWLVSVRALDDCVDPPKQSGYPFSSSRPGWSGEKRNTNTCQPATGNKRGKCSPASETRWKHLFQSRFCICSDPK